MRRPIISVILLGLLLGAHTVRAICGIRCSSQEIISTAAGGMQGMAHCHADAQTAGQHSIEEECCRSHGNHEELAFVTERQRGLNAQTIGALLYPLLTVVPSGSMLIGRNPRQHRCSPVQTSSSPESILNIRV
jgi:hypothetical protein